ncbi:hypothetical protein HDV05_004973 [Chytridiales sp. JEL 0842]|nr:hypothetical protein HDV05_004973 [Chytridiales sp. JEL 0842]
MLSFTPASSSRKRHSNRSFILFEAIKDANKTTSSRNVMRMVVLFTVGCLCAGMILVLLMGSQSNPMIHLDRRDTTTANTHQAGLGIWVSIATYLKQSLVSPLPSAYQVTVSAILKSQTNLIVAVAFLLLIALLAFPILGIILGCCMRAKRNMHIKPQQWKSNISWFFLCLSVFAAITTLVTSLRASVLLNAHLPVLGSQIQNLTMQTNDTLLQFPSVLQQTVKYVQGGVNDTIDSSIKAAVDFKGLQREMTGASSDESGRPGSDFLRALQEVGGSLNALQTSGRDVDGLYTVLIGILQRLGNRFQELESKVQTLNSNFTSTQTTNLTYTPSTPFPLLSELYAPQTFLSTLPAEYRSQQNLLSDSFNEALAYVNSLPDLNALRATFEPLLKDLEGVLGSGFQKQVGGFKGNLSLEIEERGVRVLNETREVRGKVGDAVESVAGMTSLYFAKGGKWGSGVVVEIGGIGVIVGGVLMSFACLTVVLVGFLVVYRVGASLKFMSVALAILCFLLLLIGAAILCLSVVVTGACNTILDPDATFLTTLNETLGSTVRNFHLSRATCLESPDLAPKSMIDFAREVGVLPMNGTVDLKSLVGGWVEGFNLTDVLGGVGNVSATVLLPPQVLSTLTLQLPPLISNVSTLLSPNLTWFATHQTLLAGNMSLLKDRLVEFENAKTVGGAIYLRLFRNNTRLTLSDLSNFERELEGMNKAELEAQKEAGVLAVTVGWFEGWAREVKGNVTNVERFGGGVVGNYSRVVEVMERLLRNTTSNIAAYVPTARGKLENVAVEAQKQIDTALSCKPVMQATIVIQDSMCISFISILDGLWLSFVVAGFTLFTCLSFMGCFANRLASSPSRYEGENVQLYNRADSEATLADAPEVVAFIEEKQDSDAPLNAAGKGGGMGGGMGGILGRKNAHMRRVTPETPTGTAPTSYANSPVRLESTPIRPSLTQQHTLSPTLPQSSPALLQPAPQRPPDSQRVLEMERALLALPPPSPFNPDWVFTRNENGSVTTLNVEVRASAPRLEELELDGERRGLVVREAEVVGGGVMERRRDADGGGRVGAPPSYTPI